MQLDSVLAEAVSLGASDIHLKLGRPPLVRRNGEIEQLDGTPLTEHDLLACLTAVTERTPQRAAQFHETGDLDLAYTSEGLPRFRVNVFRQRGAMSLALRVIPREVPMFTELGLPGAVTKLAEEHRGLVLVTGATGSGKTTTLAAMVRKITMARFSRTLSTLVAAGVDIIRALEITGQACATMSSRRR